jgi:transmembrane sensor
MEGHMKIQYSDNLNFSKMTLEEKILFRSSALQFPAGKTVEDALAEIKEKIAKRKSFAIPENETRRISLVRYLSIAAGILILLSLWPLSRTISMTRVNAAPGTHADYMLSDGSVVNLNAGSRIRFNKKNFSSDRKLELEGEAFFNVTRGNSFVVKTPKGIIRVLGTTFNVNSRNNTFKVTCFTGNVMVSAGKQTVTIGPGESAELTAGGMKKYRESKPAYINGWIKGEFYFENTPLNLVLNEIERQFNVKFVGKEKERQEEYYTGSFFNKDLNAALDIVCIPMGLQYVINNNGKISISDKK